MLEEWTKKTAPEIADKIIGINAHNINGDTISGFGMKQKVAAFINLIRSAMFPNIYDTAVVKEADLHKKCYFPPERSGDPS